MGPRTAPGELAFSCLKAIRYGTSNFKSIGVLWGYSILLKIVLYYLFYFVLLIAAIASPGGWFLSLLVILAGIVGSWVVLSG
jgi:hypothetical protein